MTELSSEFDLNREQADNITIMLADDHPLLRQALRSVLEKQSDFEIIAEASDGEEAVRLAVELVPNVVIMDIGMPIGMPKLNGLEATRRIKAKCPSIAILVLTVHDDSEHILSILEAGASGYLTKSVFGKEVIHAVHGVVAGGTILSASISQQIIKHALRHITKDGGEKITGRELEILRLAAGGIGNKDIAQKLDISERTVKGYLAEVFSKLNVSSRTEAVISALRAGFFTLDDLD